MKKPAVETIEISPSGTKTSKLKIVGGSDSDDFNNVLANQVVNTLWREFRLGRTTTAIQRRASCSAWHQAGR